MKVMNYNIKLINQRIENRIHYDIKIINTLNDTVTIIEDYIPSPFLVDDDDKIMDALRFVTAVSIEWLEDHRNDDGDIFFEEIYNQLSTVMNDDDIYEIYYLTHENVHELGDDKI